MVSSNAATKKTITLLLSSAGRRVELLRHFREDAADLGLDLRVVATDLDAPWCPACHEADSLHVVPPADSPAFIDQTLALCERYSVDLVVPTIDLELEPLARHSADFRARGTDVVVSSLDTVSLARDKLRTASLLSDRGIPVPKSATPEDVLANPADWPGPLMVKPRGGWSSLGLRRLASVADLSIEDIPDGCLVQELLEGDEYTVNLYFDRDGRPRCVVPHRRHEVRAGEVSKGVTCRDERIETVNWSLGETLTGARGPLCTQAIVTPDGRIGVFEINARFGGGYPLAHAAGARFTRWLLEETAGLPSTIANDWRAGVTMLRYDAALFVEEPSL